VFAPTLGQRIERGCTSHAFDVVAAVEAEARHLRDPQTLIVALELDDRIARCDLAFLGDGKVEAEEPALEELGDERVAAHLDPELEAGQARLGHDDLRGADPEAVADAEVVVDEALGREILAEHAWAEGELRSLARPELVELRRVDI